MTQKCNGVNPEVSNPLDARVSFFDSVKAVRPSREITLREFLAEVQGGVYREKVEACRAVKDDETAYREMKKDTLPAVSLSGRLKNRAAGASKGLNHSGVVQIDLDDLEDPAGVKEQLRDDPHIVFAFYSVGGDVKAGIYIDGTQHDRAFRAAERYFLEKYGVRADGAVKSPFHLCFVSADADVHIREDATPFPIPDEPQAGRTRFDRDVPDLEGWDGDPEDLPAWLQEKIESIPSAEDRSRIEMSVIEDLIRFGLSNDQILDLYVILEDTLGVRWVERNSNSGWLESQLKRARAHVAECAPGRPEDDFDELPDEDPPTGPAGMRCSDLVELDIPEISWIVPGLLATGLTVLAGKPKVGKSWFALQLCISVASGLGFLGRECVQGEVIYLALEDGPRRAKKRVLSLLNGQSAPHGLTFYYEWPRLDSGGLEALEGLIRSTPNLRLLVIDVWAKVRPLKKPRGATSYEIDYAEASRIKRLADNHNIALELVTHLRKPNGKSAAIDLFDEVSGSTGITGAADATFILTRTRNVADGELHVTGRDVDEIQLALTRNQSGGWDLIGPAGMVQRTPDMQKILEALVSLKSATPKQIAEATGQSESYVKKTLPKLLEAGAVRRLKYGVWAPAQEEANADFTEI